MNNFIMLGAFLVSTLAFGNEFPLDPPYKHIVPPIQGQREKSMPKASRTAEVLAFQTPVKSQGRRGTCSIFSALGLLESLLVKKGMDPKLDLSEEYLEYWMVRGRTTDGSNSYKNFKTILSEGAALESTLAYRPSVWSASSPKAIERCGHLEGDTQKSCHLVDFDPSFAYKTDEQIFSLFTPAQGSEDFVRTRTEARAFRDQHIEFTRDSIYLGYVSQVKRLLSKGTPLVLDFDFYYGAWNHSLAPSLELKRSMDEWEAGIVGFPEEDSKDFKMSPTKPAGHSVILVGHDDNKEVTVSYETVDGETKTKTYRGVYYFKNSWGTHSFGKNFELDGKKYPGMGMITQQYAHKYGAFFRMPLK